MIVRVLVQLVLVAATLAAAGETLRVRFGRRGRHVVAVEVSDGYGGRASASSTVAVRR